MDGAGLFARMALIVEGRRYMPGERIIASPETEKALLEAGSAFFMQELPRHRPRARAVTAEPGLPGLASDGDPDALVGKLTRRGPRRKG